MKIVSLLLEYDYGRPERGASGEKTIVFPALCRAADEVVPFWLEEHGHPGDPEGLQRAIRECCDRERPDVVFLMLMRYEVTLDTLDYLRGRAVTVNWFCDDQWRFDGYTRIVALHLSWSVTTDKYSLARYRAAGCPNVILSQWGTFGLSRVIDPDDVSYLYDVSFVGERKANREWIIDELARSGIQVHCFGGGWPAGRVDYQRMAEIFLRSRINLNLSNSIPHDAGYRRYLTARAGRSLLGLSHVKGASYLKEMRRVGGAVREIIVSTKRGEMIKGRTFEIPGCGGFQLAKFALGIEDWFVPGREIALYSTPDELKRQIAWYLEHEEERRSVCREGCRRAAPYTWENRLREILERIQAGAEAAR